MCKLLGTIRPDGDTHLFAHCTCFFIMQTQLKAWDIQNDRHLYSVECMPKIKPVIVVIFHAIYMGLCL